MRNLLESLERAFADVPRPEHFTDHTHCEECAEHDQTLRAHTPQSIGLEELGNPGWDPMCFISPEGFRYYFPGLARLVVDSGGGYLDQFLFHLRGERVAAFSAEQRRAAAEFVIAADDVWGFSGAQHPGAYVMETARRLLGVPWEGDRAFPGGGSENPEAPLVWVIPPGDAPVDLAAIEEALRASLPEAFLWRGSDSLLVYRSTEVRVRLESGAGVAEEIGALVEAFGGDRPDRARLAAAERRLVAWAWPDPQHLHLQEFTDFVRRLLALWPGAAAVDLHTGLFL